MCFISNTFFPKVANEDIICYKHLVFDLANNILLTPIQRMRVKSLDLIPEKRSWHIRLFDFLNHLIDKTIDSGYIHAIVEKDGLKFGYYGNIIRMSKNQSILKGLYNNDIFHLYIKCIIPKGTKYYLGINESNEGYNFIACKHLRIELDDIQRALVGFYIDFSYKSITSEQKSVVLQYLERNQYHSILNFEPIFNDKSFAIDLKDNNDIVSANVEWHVGMKSLIINSIEIDSKRYFDGCTKLIFESIENIVKEIGLESSIIIVVKDKEGHYAKKINWLLKRDYKIMLNDGAKIYLMKKINEAASNIWNL